MRRLLGPPAAWVCALGKGTVWANCIAGRELCQRPQHLVPEPLQALAHADHTSTATILAFRRSSVTAIHAARRPARACPSSVLVAVQPDSEGAAQWRLTSEKSVR
jgi:hypothetical protein